MLAATRAPVPIVVHQHLEDVASLRQTRSVLTRAPHIRLHLLRRLDDRIAASLDGIAVAGDVGRRMCMTSLQTPTRGAVFAAAASAIESRDPVLLEKLLALAETAPDAHAGVVSAFGWVSAISLRGITKALLESPSAFRRDIGLAACAMHQVDPGAALDAALAAADLSPRARGLRVAGECGRRDLLGTCLTALADMDAACRFWAACSAALLGDRGKSIDVLEHVASKAGPNRPRTLRLVLKLIDSSQANVLLKALTKGPSNIRLVIQSAGIAGDPHYVPWLLKQMADLKLTRLAGESFSFITGLDLAYLDLDRKPPENFDSGPNDDPNDINVAMDQDDGLSWPDPVKIQAWWDVNQQRFQPGVRYFMGERVSVEHCKKVLREGYQRQRIAAAEYLCLLQPGTQLFPTSAPAWRQLRWLNKMG